MCTSVFPPIKTPFCSRLLQPRHTLNRVVDYVSMLSALNVTACRLAARSALDGAALADCVLPASFSDRHADETVTRYVSATLKLGDRNVDFNSLPLSARIEQPFVEQWHLVTQNILFRHLRQLWADDRPRTMVDIGCHAVCCVHAWGRVNCLHVHRMHVHRTYPGYNKL